MKLAIWPFLSQQDKRTGKFLFDTCGATKQMRFIIEQAQQELGWSCVVATPEFGVFPCTERYADIPNSNLLQSVHWNTNGLHRVFCDADVALLNHELLAVPVRRMFPKLRIIQMCSVKPPVDMLDLFEAAWRRANLVVAQGEYAALQIQSRTNTPVSVWPLAWDERLIARSTAPRPIDVLFIQRCSANNATHHEEFLEAMELMLDLRIAFVDVTKFLRMRRPELEYVPDYLEALRSSKVAIAMYDSWYGGLSIREAVAAGCRPVVLNAPCYDQFPNRCSAHPAAIAAAIRAALADNKPLPDVSSESYQASWESIKRDLGA